MVHLEQWEVLEWPYYTPKRQHKKFYKVLTGIVTGHPRITDGHHLISSPLRVIDPIARTAQTENTSYTLGEPRTGPLIKNYN